MNGCTFDWSGYKPDEQAVLCFLYHGRQVLLIHKKRGLGAGKVNGPGGKREPGESLPDTAVREVREEVGLVPEDPRHHGTLRFAFADGYNLEVHLFVARAWSGHMRETDEAIPFWVKESEIPFEQMWEDDQHWLPHILKGLSVEAEMFFRGDRMEYWDIRYSDGTSRAGTNGSSAAPAGPAPAGPSPLTGPAPPTGPDHGDQVAPCPPNGQG